MNAVQVIIMYREALDRARNVVTDLEDFEWIDRSVEDAVKGLNEVAEEASRVADLLLSLRNYAKSEGT